MWGWVSFLAKLGEKHTSLCALILFKTSAPYKSFTYLLTYHVRCRVVRLATFTLLTYRTLLYPVMPGSASCMWNERSAHAPQLSISGLFTSFPGSRLLRQTSRDHCGTWPTWRHARPVRLGWSYNLLNLCIGSPAFTFKPMKKMSVWKRTGEYPVPCITAGKTTVGNASTR